MLLKKLTAAGAAVAILGSLAVMPAMAEETNLLSSTNIKVANVEGKWLETTTDKAVIGLTDGNYTVDLDLNRNISNPPAKNYTYYVIYEVNAEISSVSAYYKEARTSNGKDALVSFYGSNDESLKLLTEYPTEEIKGNDADSRWLSAYNITKLATTEDSNSNAIPVTFGDTTVYKKSVQLTNQPKYKYLIVMFNGWAFTRVSELEAIAVKKSGSLTQAAFSGTLDGATVTNDTVTKDDEILTIWKGTLDSQLTTGTINIAAESNDGKTASGTLSIPTVISGGNVEFYVLINSNNVKEITYSID